MRTDFYQAIRNINTLKLSEPNLINIIYSLILHKKRSKCFSITKIRRLTIFEGTITVCKISSSHAANMRRALIALTMETVRSSEKFFFYSETTRRNVP
jgi:hypothetical protein